MKKTLYLLFGFALLYTSCSNDEFESPENDNSLTTKASLNYISTYESSVPLYKYYIHNGDKTDHYFGLEAPSGPSGSNKTIKGRTYQYSSQDFNLPKADWLETETLYRHYSSSLNNHILSTKSNVSGYTKEINLGGIFTNQEMGAVPLMEYYSDLYKNHYYSITEIPNEPSYKYIQTIGYVYPGQRINENKLPFYIAINRDRYETYPSKNRFTAVLKLRVRERDTYTNLTYNLDFTNQNLSGQFIPLKASYAIVKSEITIYPNDNPTASVTILDLQNPYWTYNSPIMSKGGAFYEGNWGNRILQIRKTLEGYKTIFEFTFRN